MPRKIKGQGTMTELLRKALADADSLYAVSKASGVQKTSLIRFRRGDQTLRLDMAERLAKHFEIVCTRNR